MYNLNQIGLAWAEVNLDNLIHNIKEVRRLTDEGSSVMAVVKGNGYGHGAVKVAKVFLENGADKLATATLCEAMELRKANIEAPILVMGYTLKTQYHLAIERDIALTIYDYESAAILSKEAEKVNKEAVIHIKVDSGMGRIGFMPDEVSVNRILQISKLANIRIEGIFTHFATADEKDKTFTKIQYARFMNLVRELEHGGLKIPIKHVSDSAAIIDCPDYDLDMVRGGIMLYGHWPSDKVDKRRLTLKPAMTVKTRVSHIKTVTRGTSISYGQKFVAERESVIATIPIGYADGFTRMLIPNGEVYIKGVKVPVVGVICMDQSMVDVTDLENVEIGDEVVIFGHKVGYPTIEDMAKTLGTINYEILCMVGRRVPRVYMEKGEIIEVKDYILD